MNPRSLHLKKEMQKRTAYILLFALIVLFVSIMNSNFSQAIEIKQAGQQTEALN
jgi:hypothetical protein